MITIGLDHLLPYVRPEAAVVSSARHPPPTCHPGTREGIRARLKAWLDNPKRQRNVIWLTGPAGTGKSAVAQTFAEHCLERRRLGAAFFFSRSNERNKPDTVIPTLAYQLAVQFPEYQRLLTERIAHDPTIVQKAPHAQFKRLIIEPLSILELQGHTITQEPLLILLDGLDECQGIPAQCELVEMIGELVHLKKRFPLLWLVCSRPEPHLKYIFLRSDFSIDCDKEELLIDAETRGDVDRYLHDGFADLRSKFWDVTGTFWPSDEQFDEVSGTASGLFVLASAILNYLGDPMYENPATRLVTLLGFMKNASRVGAKNPLEALDLFYSTIFNEILDEVLPITRRILGHHVFLEENDFATPAQVLCNFLNIDQGTFYGALRKLHSVIRVPSPEDAFHTTLQFYHTSFHDYLYDPVRSGKFAIANRDVSTEVVQSCIFWYKVDMASFFAVGTGQLKQFSRAVSY